MLPSSAHTFQRVAPRITITVNDKPANILLDTDAELTIFPRSMRPTLLPHQYAAYRFRKVGTFGGTDVTIEGPCELKIGICGIQVYHQCYFLDADTIPVAGFYLLSHAHL